MKAFVKNLNPKRRQLRLPKHDYSAAGAYFVTVCVYNRQHLFGQIANGTMFLNKIGKIIQNEWQILPDRFSVVQLDTFVVMPNHFHGIIRIINKKIVGAGFPRPGDASKIKMGAETAPLHPVTLGQIVAYFKYQSTKKINVIRDLPGVTVWQRNYHDHIIRHEPELNQIRQYIIDNPKNWASDPEFSN